MKIRDITNLAVEPRMAKIKLNPGDTLYTEKMMREAVTAALTQLLRDMASDRDMENDND